MDCEFETRVAGDHQRPVETFRLGPQYLKQRLYQLSPAEVGDDGPATPHTHTTRPSGGLFTIVLLPLVLVGATQRRT
jgi:hypothetical protein